MSVKTFENTDKLLMYYDAADIQINRSFISYLTSFHVKSMRQLFQVKCPDTGRQVAIF